MIRKAAITFFGLGYMRPASGTWGSFGALLVAAGVHALLPDAAGWPWRQGALAVLLLAACVLSVVWGEWAIAYYGSCGRKPGDPGHFVLDEAAGQWLSLLMLPMPAALPTIAGVYAMQFVLFRVFDVIKPPPARQFERLPAGWGILVDDLASAVYVNIIGQIVVRMCLL